MSEVPTLFDLLTARLHHSQMRPLYRRVSTCTRSLSTVVIGMSGGVDSSVCALMLKEQGFEVHGVYLKNWDERDELGVCTGDADSRDARAVCDELSIPFHHVDFVKEYWNLVFSDMIRKYELGFTPNPDVLCKFVCETKHISFYL